MNHVSSLPHILRLLSTSTSDQIAHKVRSFVLNSHDQHDVDTVYKILWTCTNNENNLQHLDDERAVVVFHCVKQEYNIPFPAKFCLQITSYLSSENLAEHDQDSIGENEPDLIAMNIHDTMRENDDANNHDWSCLHCTFINNAASIYCEMCDQSRHDTHFHDDSDVQMNLHDTMRGDSDHEENESKLSPTMGFSSNTMYDIQKEAYLRDNMLEFIFNFDTAERRERKKWIGDVFDEKTGIRTHHKMIDASTYCMRGEMPFNECEDIMLYYEYLQSGVDKATVLGISDQPPKETMVIDKDHQFIYHQPNTGILSYVVAPRDVCFIRTRYKLTDFQQENKIYDICGSLNYSVDKEHPLYVPERKKWIRCRIICRTFTLVRNKNDNTSMLYYVSVCDLGGSTPQWIVSYNLGNRPLVVNKTTADRNLAAFRDSWLAKVGRVRDRRKDGKERKFTD